MKIFANQADLILARLNNNQLVKLKDTSEEYLIQSTGVGLALAKGNVAVLQEIYTRILPVGGFDGEVITKGPGDLIEWSEPAIGGISFSQLFSGNAVTTDFTLSRSFDSADQLIISIGGSGQNVNEYTVAGTNLSFIDPPISGTENITVRG